MGRGAWWATVHGVTKSWAQLSGSHTHFNLGTSPSATLYQAQALDRAQSLSSMYRSFVEKKTHNNELP